MLPPVPTLCDRTLIVPLAVVPPAEKGGTPTLLCPTFVVPQGEWTIVWNLVTLNPPRGADDPEPLQATFADGKGILPLLGQKLRTRTPWQVSPVQWAASIDNQITDPVGSIHYDVAIQYGDGGGDNGYRSKDICHHDPTIVVSKDPIEPPPSGGRG